MARFGTPRDLNSAALQRVRVHPSQTGLNGAGVVICVVDYGFDLLHPTLRTPTGETRFAALIDQNGCRLLRAEINKLIRDAERCNSRARLDKIYDPHANYFGHGGVVVGAHGSWVASIAAGSSTPAFTGVAPRATLIGVQLALPDSAWREEDHNGQPSWIGAACAGHETLRHWDGWRSYEDNRSIIAALEEGLEFAQSLRPDGIVLNLSIGAWAGGHDEDAAVNQAIADLVGNGQSAHEPMRAVVTGTGNAGVESGHFTGRLTRTDPVRFGWQFGANMRAQSKLDVWSDCPGGILIKLSEPDGETLLSWDANDEQRHTIAIKDTARRTIGIAQNRGTVRGNLSSFRIILLPTLSLSEATCNSGATSNDRIFDIAVRPAIAGQCGTVHAWLERDCSSDAIAHLVGPAHEGRLGGSRDATRLSSTLTSLACAPGVLSVAGLDNAAADDKVLNISGQGPRPWASSSATPSPLVSAPANGLFGARSKTAGFMRGSGTSGAAAVVSGACALAMQAAELVGTRLDTAQLIRALLGRAIELPTDANARPHDWLPDLGFGAMRFDAASLFDGHSPRQHTTQSTNKEPCDERVISASN